MATPVPAFADSGIITACPRRMGPSGFPVARAVSVPAIPNPYLRLTENVVFVSTAPIRTAIATKTRPTAAVAIMLPAMYREWGANAAIAGRINPRGSR